MRKLNILLIILIGSIFACKKVETLPSSSGVPVFGITANLSGDSLKIEAGEADYYLFTSFEIDTNNVRSYVSTFAKIDCFDECQDTFRIKIRDAELTTQNVNINNALFAGNYLYKSNQAPFFIEMDTTYSYNISFDASTSMISNVGNTSYNWTIGTDLFSNFLAIFDYSSDNQPDENLAVSLTINSQGCVVKHEVELAFAANGVEKNCSLDIVGEFSPASGTTILTVMPVGLPPFDYLWSDGTTGDSVVSDTLFYGVTVTDAGGCESNSSVMVNPQGNGGIACQAAFSVVADVDFTVENDTIFSPIPLQFSTVVIEYVDENGIFYSSELENQSGSAAFNLLNINDFDNNENGEQTKQLEIEFNCVLGSEAAVPSLNLAGGSGKIAVAYPD
ncbi:MAG: hypothetical protein ACI9XO_002249 [Paraglaciecola sp.]|jgi:hypothetical protein